MGGEPGRPIWLPQLKAAACDNMAPGASVVEEVGCEHPGTLKPLSDARENDIAVHHDTPSDVGAELLHLDVVDRGGFDAADVSDHGGTETAARIDYQHLVPHTKSRQVG